jgi:hypothetical protein
MEQREMRGCKRYGEVIPKNQGLFIRLLQFHALLENNYRKTVLNRYIC